MTRPAVSQQREPVLVSASAVGAVVMFVAVLPALAACGASPATHSLGPPWTVCGKVLWDAAAGVAPVDVSQLPRGRGSEPITSETAGDNLALVFSNDCSTGVRVAFSPAAAATISDSATTTRGDSVAALIKPHRSAFDIRITEADGGTRVLHVRLGEPNPVG